MPRPQRSPEAIDAIRTEIRNQAIDLIIHCGFNGFSMRKLAARLGIAAKTIYNYYTSKDELYLAILTRGFEHLYAQCLTAWHAHPQSPVNRLHSMGRAYMAFGLENANLYNLMFTWHVPKYNDYIGTPMEHAAHTELVAAMKVSDLFVSAIRDASGPENPLGDEDARFHMILLWSSLHGYITGMNNTLLDYMHEAPGELSDKILDTLMQNFEASIYATKRGPVKSLGVPTGQSGRQRRG